MYQKKRSCSHRIWWTWPCLRTCLCPKMLITITHKKQTSTSHKSSSEMSKTCAQFVIANLDSNHVWASLATMYSMRSASKNVFAEIKQSESTSTIYNALTAKHRSNLTRHKCQLQWFNSYITGRSSETILYQWSFSCTSKRIVNRSRPQSSKKTRLNSWWNKWAFTIAILASGSTTAVETTMRRHWEKTWAQTNSSAFSAKNRRLGMGKSFASCTAMSSQTSSANTVAQLRSMSVIMGTPSIASHASTTTWSSSSWSRPSARVALIAG